MKKKVICTILSLMIMSQAFASISVAPTRIEINANKVKGNYITTAIEIKGDDVKMMRFKAYPEFFTIDEKGEVVMIEKSDDIHNISKKIRFVPSEFNVLPRKSQKLRVNIANIKQLPDGENRAILYIEDVQPKNYNLNTGSDKIGAQLIVKTRIGVPVYIDKGKFTREGAIEDFDIVNDAKNGLQANLKIVSTGNSRIRFQGKVQLINEEALVDECSLGSAVVGQNNYLEQSFPLKFKKAPAGNYIARVIITYTDQNGKKQILKQDTTINIKGEM